MRILREHTAAILIDYQEKLMPVMHDKERLLNQSVKLIKGLKLLNIPMLITQQYTKGLGKTVREITECAKTDEYIDKLSFSCYDNTDVKQWFLNKEHIRYVILCGIETHICVQQTAIDLKQAGYQPVLITDCCSSRKPYDTEIAQKRLAMEGCILTSCEAVLFELMREAGSSTFKELSALIK